MTDPCSSYRRRIHLYHDGEMGSSEAREIEIHLAMCPQCRSSLEEMRSIESHLRAGLHDFVDRDRPGLPDGLGQTIDRVMREPLPRWGNVSADPSGRERPKDGRKG